MSSYSAANTIASTVHLCVRMDLKILSVVFLVGGIVSTSSLCWYSAWKSFGYIKMCCGSPSTMMLAVHCGRHNARMMNSVMHGVPWWLLVIFVNIGDSSRRFDDNAWRVIFTKRSVKYIFLLWNFQVYLVEGHRRNCGMGKRVIRSNFVEKTWFISRFSCQALNNYKIVSIEINTIVIDTIITSFCRKCWHISVTIATKNEKHPHEAWFPTRDRHYVGWHSSEHSHWMFSNSHTVQMVLDYWKRKRAFIFISTFYHICDRLWIVLPKSNEIDEERAEHVNYPHFIWVWCQARVDVIRKPCWDFE